MRISGLNGGLQNLQKLNEIKNKPAGEGFGEVLNQFVTDVNKDQLNSAQQTKDFIDGKDVELHEVMISGQKAKTSLELLIQVRNKAVDMYKELTRMQ